MAKSAISSLVDLYNSIGDAHFGGARPPIYVGQVPQTNAAGAQQRVPYVVLIDEGFRPEHNSSTGAVETGTVRLEVYAVKLDDVSGVTVDSIVRGIKFGGNAPAVRAGWDWGTFNFENGTYLYKISLRRLSERRDYAGFNFDSQRCHKAELRYEVKVGLSPS